jgi:hypothetical protein
MSKFYKGDIPRKASPSLPRPDTGFASLVSEAGNGDDLTAQIPAALAFICENVEEFQRLKDFGADNLLLDFGVAPKSPLQNAVYLPPELIQALGQFEMGLVFSTVKIGGE